MKDIQKVIVFENRLRVRVLNGFKVVWLQKKKEIEEINLLKTFKKNIVELEKKMRN